jgi:3',5'-cyclic AMP phosphodiesterase CpdA
MRIAHCSDLHLLTLEGARVLDFANKRWLGGLNLLVNRGRHYQSSVFEAMVEDFNRGEVDHVICTGDVTNLALEQEFLFARERFDRIALGPDDVTVLPGNHDAYVAGGAERFTDIFADYFRSDDGWQWPGGEPWPMVRVRGPVAIIGLSTGLATPWLTAWGEVGDAQLARLRQVLADPRLQGLMRLVAIHHPPAGPASRNRVRGLKDREAFAGVLATTGADLVIHGHEHRDLRFALPGPRGAGPIPVHGIQSGTYTGDRPERTARYRIYEITSESGELRVLEHMRRWDRESGSFVDEGPVGAARRRAFSVVAM